MHAFEQFVYDALKEKILSWDRTVTTHIYAISFYIYDEDDEPRRPSLTLGYNTIQHWKESIPQASDSDEAKWNYAYWLQNNETYIGDLEGPLAQKSAELRTDWIRSIGLEYTDEDEEQDSDRTFELGRDITKEFVALSVRVARRLHDDGIIFQQFGTVTPILVHELEYYDEIANQTREANPPGVADEYFAWVIPPWRRTGNSISDSSQSAVDAVTTTRLSSSKIGATTKKQGLLGKLLALFRK